MTKAQRIAEKMGLIKQVPNQEQPDGYEEYYPETEENFEDLIPPNVDSELSADALETVRKMITQTEENLGDGILKVEEIMNSLPSTLPNDVKRETVKNLLKNFSLEVNSLLEDGEKRIGEISLLERETIRECKQIIEENENCADDLKKQLAATEATIQQSMEKQLAMNIMATKEKERIEGLMTFLNPDS